MILHCDFEELQALKGGAELVLDSRDVQWTTAHEAEPDVIAEVTRLHEVIGGALSVPSLAEMDSLMEAVELITDTLHDQLRATILDFEPSHEAAIALYFDWARSQGVLHRLSEMAAEMTALIELMTGASPTAETAASVTFPD